MIVLKMDRIHLGGPKSGLDRITVELEQHSYCCADGCCDKPEDGASDKHQIQDTCSNQQAFRKAVAMMNALLADGEQSGQLLGFADWIRTAPGARPARSTIYMGGLF